MTSTPNNQRRWISPWWLVLPGTAILFALGGKALGGLPAMLTWGATGLAWAIGLGLIARLIRRGEKLRFGLATASLLAAGALLFFTQGAGTLEYMLMGKAMSSMPEWLTTITSGPLADQDILFFVIFNTLLEAVVVPLLIFLNWHHPERRRLVLVGALLFYAIRIWTYFYFAPAYFNYDDVRSTQELVDTLRTRMLLDVGRMALNFTQAALFLWAAVRPPSLRGADRLTPHSVADRERVAP
jgi:hypothetical protein